MRFGLIFSLLLALLAVILALQNPQTMDVNLFYYHTQGSTALILIITFALGAVVGLLSSLPGRLRTRRKLKELQKRQKKEESGPSFPSSESSSDPSSPAMGSGPSDQ